MTSVHLDPETAILGDFTGSATVYVRDEGRIDWSEHLYSPNLLGEGEGGSLFGTNQVVFRAESRVGLAVLRPSAFTRRQVEDDLGSVEPRLRAKLDQRIAELAVHEPGTPAPAWAVEGLVNSLDDVVSWQGQLTD